MKANRNLRNPLANARGLGAAQEGVHHWWGQRVSAFLMIPLSTWMIYTLIAMMRVPDTRFIQVWLSDPMAALPLMALLALMFYHARLGLQVVIEDYVHSQQWKITLLLMNIFFCATGAALSVLSILKLHLSATPAIL